MEFEKLERVRNQFFFSSNKTGHDSKGSSPAAYNAAQWRHKLAILSSGDGCP